MFQQIEKEVRAPIASAEIFLASIGTIANFERAVQLKSYFGWAPRGDQLDHTRDQVRLTSRG